MEFEEPTSPSDLNQDLLRLILSRIVDGLTLSAATSASTDLHRIASEDRLWERLCHTTWPSVLDTKAKATIKGGGFSKFYGDCFPRILYKPVEGEVTTTTNNTARVEPADLVSLVDVHYKNKCVFSRALHGVPITSDIFDDSDEDVGLAYYGSWFLDCPFRMDVLAQRSGDEYVDYIERDGGDDEGGDPQQLRLETEEEKRVLEENVRVSWIIMNAKTGEAVNLSSWKPRSVQKNWLAEGDLVMKFGCAVGGSRGLRAQNGFCCWSKPAECVITLRCRCVGGVGEVVVELREIGLHVVDVDGVHLSGRSGLEVLDRALRCDRSGVHGKVEMGYRSYDVDRAVAKVEKDKRDWAAERIWIFIVVAVFASVFYFF
ncbi:F-box protein [Acorus gramineus]|uniref:F-box protein n=1 Tax=Acorus gramineus TaxID=55184 RepID=A0AAV9BBH1_ACOGR|nr:F-box protein [Acorus gramineus]